MAALMVLAGCGGSASSTTSGAGATSPAATGYAFTADVFTVSVPASWQNKTQDTGTYQKVVRTAEGTGTLVLVHPVPGQFSNSINDVEGNIVVMVRTEAVPDDALQTFAGQARKGVTSLTTPATQDVDSTVGYAVSYKSDIQGTPGQTEEVLFNHGNKTYDVSLTTSQYAFHDQEHDLMTLMRSWKWTK
jgi:hypothetical protein